VVRDYIFVADVIDALRAAAADRSDARVFNVGSGHGRSLREMLSNRGHVEGRPRTAGIGKL
jgi:UDP-glucose 4-epimerase